MKCEVYVDEIRLEYVFEFKYMRCVLNESGTDEAECSKKISSGRRVAGAIKTPVNARSLQPESILMPVLAYGSETMIWR